MGTPEEVCNQGVWKVTPACRPVNSGSPTHNFNFIFHHVGKMSQWVSLLAAKLDNLSLPPGTHAAGENLPLQGLPVCRGRRVSSPSSQTHKQKQVKYKKILK